MIIHRAYSKRSLTVELYEPSLTILALPRFQIQIVRSYVPEESSAGGRQKEREQDVRRNLLWKFKVPFELAGWRLPPWPDRKVSLVCRCFSCATSSARQPHCCNIFSFCRRLLATQYNNSIRGNFFQPNRTNKCSRQSGRPRRESGREKSFRVENYCAALALFSAPLSPLLLLFYFFLVTRLWRILNLDWASHVHVTSGFYWPVEKRNSTSIFDRVPNSFEILNSVSVSPSTLNVLFQSSLQYRNAHFILRVGNNWTNGQTSRARK